MGYSIIADISNALVNLLRGELVPGLVQGGDGIGLCSPDEKGDFVVGITLYDLEESEEIVSQGMTGRDFATQAFPSCFLSLYYMITVYSASDLKFRQTEEQRIMGRIIQALRDTPVITPGMLGEGKEQGTYKIKVELQKIDRYEKVRLWNYPNVPFKPSLYYKIYPVEVRSRRTREVRRVMDLEFSLEEKTRE